MRRTLQVVATVLVLSLGTSGLVRAADDPVLSTIDFGNRDIPRDVATLSDGSVMIVGPTQTGSTRSDFAVAKLTPRGKLDRSFAGDGKARVSFGGADHAVSVVPTTDGSLVAGTTAAAIGHAPERRWAVAKFDPLGALDPSFARDGKLVVDPLAGRGTLQELSAAVLAADGRNVYLAGHGVLENGGAGDRMVAIVLRVSPDGSLDTAFGDGGRAIFSFRRERYIDINTTELHIDGDLLIAGRLSRDNRATRGDFLIAKIGSDGALDPTFGDGGVTVTNFGGSDAITSVDVMTDGRILAAGFRDHDSWQTVVARYTRDGRPDESFSENGRMVLRLGTNEGGAESVDARGTGPITLLLNARWCEGCRYTATLVRLRRDGRLDTGFGAGGIVDTELASDYRLSMETSRGRHLIALALGRVRPDFGLAVVRD